MGPRLLAFFAISPFLAALGFQSSRQPSQAPSSQDFAKIVQPTAKKYCGGCHTGASSAGGFDIGKTNSAADVAKLGNQWRAAAKRVFGKSMPPAGSPAPTDSDRNRFVNAINRLAGPAPKSKSDSTGSTTLRRLNRAEYNNSVRDLLYGMTITLADDFPSDDVGYGFDNIGDVLSISPLLMERYLDAAEAIAKRAVIVAKPRIFGFDASNLRIDGAANVGTSINMYGATKATGVIQLESAGTFKVRIRAFGQQAGPDPARMSLSVDGKRATIFDVKAVGEPQLYEAPIELAAGKRSIEVAFINDYYQPNDPDPRNRDRNLIVHGFEVTGPTPGSTPIHETHRRVVFAFPDSGSPEQAARRVLGEFARRAYRRPVTEAEKSALARFVTLAMKDGEPYERGIQLGVTAVLASPHFLFRRETDNGLYGLASRLSYFLWSSMPDESLFQAAQSGRLADPLELDRQVTRMLKDPKADAMTRNFASQWLQLRKLDGVTPDPTLFPDFDEALRRAMRAESEAFFDYALRENRPVRELLNANYTFLNERLALHYGIEGVKGTSMRKVDLSERRRGGLLTHAGILTLTSNPNRTSPVKRGKYVLEQILGEPPPPPPPGAGSIEGDTDLTPTKTMKERLAKHRRDPACANCHLKMDTIGFAFENFDPVGRWREKDGPFDIDAAGQMPDGRRFASATDMRSILLADRKAFSRSLAEKLWIYAMGRGPDVKTDSALDIIVADAEKRGGGLADLIRSVCQSSTFRVVESSKMR